MGAGHYISGANPVAFKNELIRPLPQQCVESERKVSLVLVNNKEITVSGKFVKIARLEEEWYEDIDDPVSLISKLKNSNVRADIFTFWQRLPDTKPKYSYYMEWDNIAAITIKTYDYWFEKQINRNSRRAIQKAKKSKIDIRKVNFNESLVKGIFDIFNETPVRQGRRFWHYGKDYQVVKEEMSRDMNRCDFFGAYYKDNLIGFIKLIYTRREAFFAQILSKIEHRDKSPTNALIAKAIEVCVEKNIHYLIYGRFDYGKKGSNSLKDFKRRNGFNKIDIPRYYIPLTIKGEIVLKLNLHHGIVGIIPKYINEFLLNLRKKWYSKQ